MPPVEPQMRLVRLFVVNGAMGFCFGLAIAGALVVLDVGTLAALARQAQGGALALGVLAAGLGITCAGAAIATAVMLLPYGDDDGGGRRVRVRQARRGASHMPRD